MILTLRGKHNSDGFLFLYQEINPALENLARNSRYDGGGGRSRYGGGGGGGRFGGGGFKKGSLSNGRGFGGGGGEGRHSRFD